MMSVYNDNADLISIGAYKSGSNPALDTAIKKIDAINDFLIQPVDKKVSFKETVDMMRKIVDG